MNNYGFIRVAAASPSLKVTDCEFNTNEIIKLIKDAEKERVKAIAFPEMCITSYTAQDLLNQQLLVESAVDCISKICEETSNTEIISIVGTPLSVNNRLYNVAVVIAQGKVWGVVPKIFLPTYNEFYDKRWFSSPRELRQSTIELAGREVPIGTNLIFKTDEFKFGIEICEDLWTSIPPSSILSLYGAEIIFNPSASPETVGKHPYRKTLVCQQSARCIAGYVYAASGNGESTSDLVFAGSSMIAENGELLAEGERFSFQSRMCITEIDIEKLRNDRIKNKSFTISEYKGFDNVEYKIIDIDNRPDSVYSNKNEIYLNRFINPTPFVPSPGKIDERCSEIFSIQVGGLAKRLIHTGIKTAVIGVSGGLDSTLALLVMINAFDKLNIPRENIYGITMPGFGTTNRTYNNALDLMKYSGVTIKEIPIKEAVSLHFKDIEHNPDVHDITYENSQARERTQILMDYANKVNGLVVGTGDLSELALGWCTYNGDHMSMYAVNTGIPKTLVKTLVRWVAENHMDVNTHNILIDILDTPVSPELLPTGKNGEILQKTEDSVGPYILHDFFLFNMLRCGYGPLKIFFLARQAFRNDYNDKEILKWLKTFYRRFFSQQFKRSCMPDGPKVGSINLSPRGDWRMASDACAALWLKQLDAMQ